MYAKNQILEFRPEYREDGDDLYTLEVKECNANRVQVYQKAKDGSFTGVGNSHAIITVPAEYLVSVK